MSAPDVQINIQDPGIGIVPAGVGKTQAKLGTCNKGTPATVYSVSSVQSAKDQIGSGPLLDAVAQVLAVAGGPVLVVPLTITSEGAGGSLTLTGVGSGTITSSGGPEAIVKVKIILGGARTTATYQVAIGSGAYGSTITTAANARVIGQYFTNLGFAADTYVADDVYQLNLDGTVTLTGSGTSTSLNGSTSSPLDSYILWVEITTSGAVGTSKFRYSLDGGNDWSESITTVAKYVIPGTGVVLAFAGTFTVGDLYKGTTSPCSFGTSQVTAGYTALRSGTSEFGFSHVVGTPSSAANAASMFSTVGTAQTADETDLQYHFAQVECPQSESDATIKTAFASLSSARVGVSVGDDDLISPLTGLRLRRNNAWAYTARLSATKLSAHPGQVAATDNGGPIKNVPAIYPVSDFADMDANRFTVMRNIRGQAGYFVTRGRLLASAGSDFAYVQNRRVMDAACTTARAALTLYLNSSVRLDDTTGFIDERDALGIEAVLGAKLRAALISTDEASSVSVSVSRTDNIASTGILNVEISVVPKGYLETIRTSIAYKNPALLAAA